MKLTIKQKRFADEYLISGNATDAYKKAGYRYSSDSMASVEGHKLLRNPKVSEYINKRMEQLDDEMIMKQKEIMQRLTRIGRREETESVVVTLKERKSFYDERGKKVSIETERAEVVGIPAKLSDTNKSLELLGKNYVMWTDKTEVDANLSLYFEDDYGDEAD